MRCLLLALLLVATPLAAAKPKPPKLPAVETLIDHAKAAVADGTVDPARDLAPLIERLPTADESDQSDLIYAIETLGRHDGTSPAAVKAYLRQSAPPALLAVARSKADSLVRSNALMVLRALNASDAAFDEAIAIAQAAPERDVQFRGRLLADWKESRGPVVEAAPAAASSGAGTSAKEQAALEYLRGRREMVSAYNLGQAAAHADTELVAALLDAGVDVNSKLVAGMTPLSQAAGMGCVGDKASLEDRLATIDLLIQRGADLDQRDNGGNTVLVGAIHCPLPVVQKLVDAGVSVSATGSTSFSALQFAFAQGKWDIAEFLVSRGARISKKAVDELFFEKPTDPKKLALIQRATAK